MLNLGRLQEVPSTYLFASAAQIMRAMLMRGFTTVRDAAGADRGMADAVAHDLVVGPKLRVSGLALSQTGGHCDFRYATEFSTIITCACQVSTAQLGRIADGVGRMPPGCPGRIAQRRPPAEDHGRRWRGLPGRPDPEHAIFARRDHRHR